MLVVLTACHVYDSKLLMAAAHEPDTHSARGDGGRPAEHDASAVPDADGGREPEPRVRDAAVMDSAIAGGDAHVAGDSGRPDGGIQPPPVDAEATDECPGDTSKTTPGVCGCGVAENCSGLRSALVHRYRFQGVGATVVDSRSAANGTTASPLTGTSVLTLSGASGSHATLPSGLLSALSAATIEFWLNWQGGSPRQGAVSFGTATPNRANATCTGSPDYFSGSWYQFCLKDGTMSWSKARGVCEAAGGFLVAIESAAEDRYLASNPAFTESVWLGANDLQTDGEWCFANRDGLQAGGRFWLGDERGSAPAGAYENWRRDQPNPSDNDPNVDCAFMMKPTGTWTAYACEYDGSFVCEWRGHRGSSMDRGVFFTPADDMGRPALSVQAGTPRVVARGTKPFPIGEQIHVALEIDPPGGTIALYIDGALAASAAATGALTELRDVDNWLGRSHATADPGLSGSISELRIYDRALTAAELVTSNNAGTDPLFLE